MSHTDPPSTPPAVSSCERQRLLRLALRFCWNASDAEDALQDALVHAMEKAAQLQDPSSRWAWLCRIVVRQCHLLGRKRQNRREHQLEAEWARGTKVGSGPMDREELGEIMKRLLVSLPEQQRTALTLRHIEQMGYTQIAAIMELSEGTVRAHVSAGRETLRKLILARHPEWKP